MGRFGRGRKPAALPDEVFAGLQLAPRDRVMAFGIDTATGGYAVLTRHRVVLVAPTGWLGFSRPWHDVASGGWDPVTGTISVAWADGGRSAMLTFGQGHDDLADVFRERVQASVVTSDQVLLDDDEGPASAGRVSLRKNLATEELLVQVKLNRGVRRSDPDVAAALERAIADLWEQVGR